MAVSAEEEGDATRGGFEPLNGGVGPFHAARWKSALDLCAFSAGSTAYTCPQLPKGCPATA
jgi:hypothetical protein